MSDTDDPEEVPEENSNFPRFRFWNEASLFKRVLITVGGAGFLIVVFAFLVGFFVANNPSLCGWSCHATAAEYKTWTQSSHSSFSCYTCHYDPSYTGPPVGRFYRSMKRYVVYRLDIYQRPINGDSAYAQNRVTSERCIRCHPLETQKFKNSKGLKADRAMHMKHTDAGLLCATCHNRVAHKGAEALEPISTWVPGFKYQDFMTMRYGCKRCHVSGGRFRNPTWTPPKPEGLLWRWFKVVKFKNGTGAKRWEKIMKKVSNVRSPCPRCHTPDFNFPKDHEKSDWRTRHGVEDEAEYRECLSCHGAGKKYDNNGKLWCGICHDEKALTKKFSFLSSDNRPTMARSPFE